MRESLIDPWLPCFLADVLPDAPMHASGMTAMSSASPVRANAGGPAPARAPAQGIARALRLRALREDDLPRFLAYRSDADVARFQGWAPMDEAAARAFLREAASERVHAPGAWRQFAIAGRDGDEDDALLGDLGLWRSEDGREAELGISISPALQGQGIGAAVIHGVCALLIARCGIVRVHAAADTRNTPCLRMLARAGMRDVGRRRSEWKSEWCEEILFVRDADGL
jgi:RimJ/RimL family protein N-acetyltransferase